VALIKRSDADTFARQAVSVHLGDLEVEGDAMVAEASTRAEAIIANGRRERDLLVAGGAERGYKAGFTRGHAEGFTKGLESGETRALESTTSAISGLAEQWGTALARFEDDRDRMLSEARADVVRLAAVFAERVTRRAVDLDQTVVERAMEAVLRRVIGATELSVAVHPDDLERANRLMPAMVDRIGGSGHATINADGSLSPGSCVARTAGGGVIDASIETEIARMIDALLPDEAMNNRRTALEGGDAERVAGDTGESGSAATEDPEGGVTEPGARG